MNILPAATPHKEGSIVPGIFLFVLIVPVLLYAIIGYLVFDAKQYVANRLTGRRHSNFRVDCHGRVRPVRPAGKPVALAPELSGIPTGSALLQPHS